ncbi:F-box/kelch-repeat protein At3g23880-like [Rutidosis leptorrhynchoides]|uniref:F-box/kelch-repeat protein At3g23880-like n=1 Tax=Rutidosis leptorrhynchoides TaxID=125765 RepID=UPI003A98F7CE
MTLKDEHHQQQSETIKTAQSSEEPQSVPTLLTEIIVEILTRLPVESLLRCKSVCKLWRSLISDPHFINSHLYLSSNRNNYANHRLIFNTVRRRYLKTCKLFNVLYDKQPLNAIELDYPLKQLQKSVSIVGSCNGLLCIAIDEDKLFIWNPTTRRSNRLPYCGFEPGPGWYVSYGFGYDTLTDDYKVVGIPCVYPGVECDTKVKIYSLRTGNWKEVGDFPHKSLLNDDGKFSNGALHWAVWRYFGSSYSWTIVSVDLGNESYGEVPQPVYDEGKKDLSLGVLGENLSVVCVYRGKCADVWVMKVYGEQDSWTKLVSVPYMTDPGRHQYSAPLFFSNDGKVLLRFGSKLVVYDSKNSLLLEIQNFDKCVQAYPFVESMVSPN